MKKANELCQTHKTPQREVQVVGYLSLSPGRHEGTEEKQHVSIHTAFGK